MPDGATLALSMVAAWPHQLSPRHLNPNVALFFAAFLPQFVDPWRGAVAAQIVLLGPRLLLPQRFG